MDYPAFTQDEWLFVLSLRRSHIEVDHEGKLKIVYDESPELAAKRLHDAYRAREASE
jgi:hypothetical protein